MVKHTQTIPRLFPRNCLSVFDHFVELALKGLNLFNNEREIYFTLCDKKFIGLVKNFKTFYFHDSTWVRGVFSTLSTSKMVSFAKIGFHPLNILAERSIADVRQGSTPLLVSAKLLRQSFWYHWCNWFSFPQSDCLILCFRAKHFCSVSKDGYIQYKYK